MSKIAILSVGIRRIPNLEVLLGAPVVFRPRARAIRDVAAVAGWGNRRPARKAMDFARRNGLPCLTLEDGFIRSLGLGREDPPLSLSVDDRGVYYDATAGSRLEALVMRGHSADERARAERLCAAWRRARVSKYNHARDYVGELPGRYVLVADQTRGDAAIRFGAADDSSFGRMLKAALAENPECEVLLKVHPEVMAGRKKGHFDLGALALNPRVHVIGEDVHPASLIESAEAVYAVTSQVGFEGLLWGKRVRTFGMPFYAGWGLTLDELPAPSRRRRAALVDLVHAALVEYPRYIDPETGSRCEPERVIEWMGLQRRMRERFPAEVFALGLSRWKRPIVRAFLQGSSVHFVSGAKAVRAGATVALWGKRPAEELPHDSSPIRLEDGFLRSVGLGADLIRPVSWVVDRRGIYYDATIPSDLEHLLQTLAFDAAQLARARALRDRIVACGLTKYNVGGLTWQRPDGVKRVILVPGQVESDASIAFGAPGMRRNIELLRAVRAENPSAYLIYKPHPDVLAGLRACGQGEDQALGLCNELVTDATMGDLLGQVDEVHVLTSLAGFEALLRGKRVVTWGQPFYAGWGLTDDRAPVSRRTRRLSLDELVAGALIEYPTYVSRITGRFTTPERALDELLAWRAQGGDGVPFWRRVLRPVLRFMKRCAECVP